MRVRAHVQPLAAVEGRLAHLVEEDEGADHPAMRGRQRAADREAIAQIADRGQDDQIDAVDF